jgi:hypothetical protein
MFKHVAGVGDVEMSPAEIAARSAEEAAAPSLSDRLWTSVRAERDRRLVESDPFLAPDRDVDQNAWIAYRQLLRDLPETVTDPGAVVWPERPPSDGAVT